MHGRIVIGRGAAAGAESSCRRHSGQELNKGNFLLLLLTLLGGGKAQIANTAHLLTVTVTAGAAQEIEEGDLQAGTRKRHPALTAATAGGGIITHLAEGYVQTSYSYIFLNETTT